MTTTDLLFALLGGALVSMGIMAAAIADRIRGHLAQRRMPPAESPRVYHRDAVPISRPPAVTEFVPDSPPPRRRPKATPAAARPVALSAMASDCVAALMQAGYSKADAVRAVTACAPSEQTSLANWTLAALRRCVREASS